MKYGDGDINKALEGAEFVLYKDGEEVPLTFVKEEKLENINMLQIQKMLIQNL